MNRTRMHPRSIRRSVLASAIACCFAPAVLANPVGPSVAHGQASFNSLGKTLTVTNTPGAIINWQGFSIGAGETTRFVQQNAASAVLNRVVGKNASAIFGALQSNGRVFLINPNGILFGAGAQIDTAGLVASTLNMLDSDFIMGKMRFGDTPGAGPLSNAGEIRTPIGGRVLLIASESVENSGIIHSPKGEVILAAGKSVELADSANPEVRVEISAPEARAVNLGRIVAESGRVGIYGGIVANRGIVSADSAVVENGKIVFKATQDAGLAAGDTGGGRAVLSDNGRIVFKTGGEPRSDEGSASAVLTDNGRIVFRTAAESSPEAGGASAIVVDNGRVVFKPAMPKRSPEVVSLTGPLGESTVAGESGRITFKATTEASLDAGSTTSASGPTGGSIDVISGGGTTLVAGSVQATGSQGSGGVVRLLGERVGLIGTGSVDVSGERGGGTALVGGDLKGGNASVPNAQMTYFGDGASIRADARGAGDGGKVIVWADDSTRSYGAISARGGRTGGDGGFVETSGKRALDVRRGPDLRAPAGKSGTWLLDPNDLTVVAGAGLDPATNTGAPFFAPLADGSTIGVELINAQLDFGSDVVLNTTSRGTGDGTQAGNITILAPIGKRAETNGVFIGTTDLILQAHNDIVIGPGGSITSTGDPLNVTLQANFDGVGGGGVTIGGAIVTNGGSFSASGRDAITLGAPINTMRDSSGGFVQLNSTGNSVILAAPITSGNFVSATAQGGTLALTSSIASASSVSLSGRDGVSIAGGSTVTTGPFHSFSASVTGSSSGAALDIGAGAAISSRGATLTADTMNIQGVVNAADGNITVRPTSSGHPINIGTESASALSLTQPELDKLLTTGTFSLGNSSTGPITVSGTVSGVAPSFVFVTSGTSFTQNAAASLSGGLSINAPAITIAAPLSAGAAGITFTTDSLTVSNSVVSGGNLDVTTRSFGRQISLGVASPAGSALEMTDAQIDLLSTPTRLRFSTAGLIDIAGPVSPAGATTLSLASSSNAVTQQSLATITVPSLAVSARTGIDLPEHNDVSNFAAQIQCCSAGNIDFVAAAGRTLNVTTVDGIAGVSVNNFVGTGNIVLQADDFNISSAVRANLGNVEIRPETAGRTVTLGADVAATLSLNSAEIGLLQGTTVSILGDVMNIAGPVSFAAPTTTLGPVTVDRAVKILGAKTGTALELLPGEISNLTGATVILGGPNAGPVSVAAATTVPNTVSKLVLHSGGTSSSVTIGLSTPLVATNHIGITADTLDLQAGVTSSNGNIEIATHTPTQKIDLGIDPGGSLGLDAAEIGRLSATAGTISFATAAGDIEATGGVSFPNAAGVLLDAGGTFRLLTAGSVSSGGALAVRAPAIDIQGMTSMTAGGTGDLNLVSNTLSIVAAGTALSAPGNINIRPRDFRSIDLGGADTGFTLGLDNAELGTLNPTGIIRIGETGGFTGDINISAPISLPGRTLSLKTGDGSITQGALATLTAAALAAEASDDITLNAANQVGSIALRSWFDPITFMRGPGGALALNSVDDLSGVHAGIFSFTPMPVTLTADQIDINQSLIGSTISLVPTAGLSIDVGTRSGFGFTQADFDRISATSVSIGNSLADDLTVSAPITISSSNFSNLALVTANAAAVNAAVTVPGDLSITSSSMSISGALTSTGGGVALVTDSISVGNTVSAFNAITVRPVTGTVHVDLGTDTGGKLALTDAEIDNLLAPALIFGPTPRIDITAAVTPAPVVQSIQLITDDLIIPGTLTVPNLFVSTVTSGRTIDLGTSGFGTFMGLDAATLGRLSISDTLSFSAPGGTSTITVSAPGLAIPANDLALGAGTLNINESLAMPGEISLRADLPLNIAAGKTVTSSGGGDILVAPRSGSMTFGAGGLLDSARLAQLVTTGFLELGDGNTSAMTIAQPLNGSAFGGVLLTAFGNVSQTSGSTITASKLGVLSTFGTVTLNEANAVGTLAGTAGSFSGFNFTNAGPLTIGTVGALTGVSSGGLVTLRADSLNIVDPVIGSTVTLAPRVAGAAIDLGTDTGFGLTDAELDRISAFNLNIGESGASGSGPITVSAPVDYSGNLNLRTTPGSSIAVNAALGSSSSGAVSMDAGAGGSVNIAAPVGSSSNISVIADSITTSSTIVSDFGSVSLLNVGTSGSVAIGGGINARNSIFVTGKTIAVNAPLQADFGSVNLTAPTGASGSSTTINDSVTAGSSISITTDNLAINAPLEGGFLVTLQPRSSGTDVSVGLETPGAFSITSSELGLIETNQLSVGNSSSGDLVVNAPIGPFGFSTLELNSGGNVSQTAGSTITVRTGDESDPSSIRGSLRVFAGGRIDLPEANNVAESVSGAAAGPGNDFVFNNASPLRLQNISGVSIGGRVLVRTAPPTFSSSANAEDVNNAIVRELNNASDVGENLKKSAEDRKDEADKREREEQKKRGTQSCS